MKSKVLVIDDDSNIHHAIRLSLRGEDQQLLVTDYVEKALMVVEKHEVSVVLSGCFRPIMKGVEVLSRIKEIAPLTMRVLLTCQCCLGDTIKSINEVNVYRYLQKPCSTVELRKVVNKAIIKHKELVMLAQLSQAKYTQDILGSLHQNILNRNSVNNSLLDYRKIKPGMKLVKDLKTKKGTLLAKSGHTFSKHDLTFFKSLDIADKVLKKV